MESTFVREAAQPAPPAPEQPRVDDVPAPTLIFLSSEEDAAVCDVDGECL